GADYLIMLTGVPKVYLDFKKPSQRALDRLTVSEAKEFMKSGHFPGGSMGPKIEASINFVEQGSGTAIITDFESMSSALRGENGTRIVSDQVLVPLKRE
ncbi:MAG TPA: carbamate kinase, partial [Desulfosporosinus sp.]|nr:carbamate kinase [Desulfosporosinus sp.]